MNSKTLYKMALEKWGKSNQITRAIEECAELIKALAKRERKINGSSVDDILGKIADVELLIEQLKIIFDYDMSFIDFDKPFDSKYEFIKVQRLRKLEKLLND